MKRRSLFSLLLASSAGAALVGGRSLSRRSVLAPLLPLWQSRRLAVALGVGWPRPNRSHFKAADQWATSSPSGEGTGWLAASLAALAAGLERLPMSGDNEVGRSATSSLAGGVSAGDPGADQQNPMLAKALSDGWLSFRVASSAIAPRLSPATTGGRSVPLTGQLD